MDICTLERGRRLTAAPRYWCNVIEALPGSRPRPRQGGLPGVTHCVNTVKQDLEVSDVTGIQLMDACPDMCPEKQLEGHSTASHWASAKAG